MVELKHLRDFCFGSRQSRSSSFDIGYMANVLPYEGGFIGVSRTGATNQDDNVAILRLNKDFEIVEEENVTKGEDSRSFFYKNQAFALTWDPHRDSNGAWVFSYKVINLKTKKVTTLSIDKFPVTKVEVLGKNWIPLVKNDILYFVVTVEPNLCMIRCNLDTGECVWETPIPFIEDSLHITSSRGGTPFIFHKPTKRFIGLGHRTHNCHYHSPFLYSMDSNFEDIYIGEDIDMKFSGVGDPLSIYEEKGKLYCCVAHFPIQLGDTCEAHSSLYEIQIGKVK